MKIKTFLIFLIFPSILFSQVKSTIDFVTGFEYSFRTLITSSNEEIINTVLEYREGESGKLNFRLGFNYNQKLSEKIYLKTGARLASVGYKSKKISGLVFFDQIDPSQGLPPSEVLGEYQHIYDYWFIEVPIIGRFEFNNKKFVPFIEAGISSNFYLTTKTKTIKDESSKTHFYDETKINFNRFHFSVNLSFGANYHINQKWILFGQPIFRYHFTKLVDAPIKEYLYNYGIELGVRMKIK